MLCILGHPLTPNTDSKGPVMTKAPLDPSNKPPPAEPDQYMYARQDSDAAQHPRLIEEHHVVGPQGEDDIEATPSLSTSVETLTIR
jgi:hypothetical protein